MGSGTGDHTRRCVNKRDREVWAILAILFGFGLSLALAAPGCGPGEAPAGEEAGNQLSFPVVFPGSPFAGISAGVAMGGYSLGGQHFLGDGVNPPCLPDEVGCDPGLPFKIYLQKDPANLWQAYSLSEQGTLVLSNLDVSDNLEAVPWKDRSVVRVEFVPFVTTDLTGFEMLHVSGLAVEEVWGGGAKASISEAPVAQPFAYGYATAYATCMAITLAKLHEGTGAIEELPGGTYSWTGSEWTGACFNQTIPATAEINVKGKIIYGYNWMLRRMAGIPSDQKAGWWRLTFHEDACGALIPFDYTAEDFSLFEPLAAPEVEVSA